MYKAKKWRSWLWTCQTNNEDIKFVKTIKSIEGELSIGSGATNQVHEYE
jgi:hypothetical protein